LNKRNSRIINRLDEPTYVNDSADQILKEIRETYLEKWRA